MTDTVSPFFPPAGEVRYYLPQSDLPFLSFGLWSERIGRWVPMMFSDKRERVAGLAARAAENGFDYWVIPFERDDEQAEIAAWRAIPPPGTPEFRSFLGRGFHAEDDPNR